MKCHLCKQRIDIESERYTHIEDWNKKEVINDIWTHLKCFRKAMNRDLTRIEKEAGELMNKMKPLIKQLEQ